MSERDLAKARPIRSTYRLQLTPDFGFDAARELVGYLADLGVSHLYLSPILQARTGSTHGYDVADPSRVSQDLGGEPALRTLADTAHAAGLGLIADIVPNHLGIGPDNADWQTLLAEGHSSEGARVFDVDWHPPLPGADGKVILPVLGDHYGTVLYNGELSLVDQPDAAGRRFHLRYYDQTFPLSPESLEALERVGGVDAMTGVPGQPATWVRLHALLERQHYRLVHWRIGDRIVNYRRFFAVSDLAGVRQEDPHVFDRTHAKVLDLVAEGVLDGLRIDHPDGLRNPREYLAQLADRTGGIWTVVEKITHPGEPLEPWATAGTTGYEFCNDVVGLFVDPAAMQDFDAWAAELGADPRPYGEQVAAAKREVLDNDLAAEFTRLTRALWTLAQEHLEVRDIDDRHCASALRETLVGMPVYRTYVDPESGEASLRDREVIGVAVDAGRAHADASPYVMHFLASVLTGDAGTSPLQRDFAARFQQVSGALMAKGVEDTVFYRYLRLVALNEVGGDPSHFGLSVEEFHARNAVRCEQHPAGMLTTATHDTKHGEDVRLRIAALTEMPQRWASVATPLAQSAPIDGPTAGLLLQTLVGMWPATDSGEVTGPLRDRLVAYAVKATREAGLHTNWYDPDAEYEHALELFVDGVLGDDRARKEIAGIASAAAEIGMVSGLAQVVLRTLSPGVPDTYQGNELWDDSLVDPDNRRPVDWEQRRAVLHQVRGEDAGALWADRRNGRIKLRTLATALSVRAAHPEAFGESGGYEPLAVTGRWADRAVAFARTAGGHAQVVVVVPRLAGAVMGAELAPPLGNRWDDTRIKLPPGDWDDALTGRSVPEGSLAALFADFPLAILVRRD